MQTDRVAPTEIRIKGTAFVGVVRSLEVLKGPDFKRDVLAALEGEGGETLRANSVLASGWYAGHWYRDLLNTAGRQAGSESFVREVGRVSTREAVSAVHRLFMRFITPDTLIKQSARVFSSFFEAELVCELKSPGCAHVMWKSCYGFDRACWLDQIGAVDVLAEMSRAKSPRVRFIGGGADGDSSATAECQWG